MDGDYTAMTDTIADKSFSSFVRLKKLLCQSLLVFPLSLYNRNTETC